MLHENLRLYVPLTVRTPDKQPANTCMILSYVSNDAYTLVADSDKPETLVITRASNEVSILCASSLL